MYCIITINDLQVGDKLYQSQCIMDYLLKKDLWAFSPGAPCLKRLQVEDKILIYLAGKGRRCFAATFTISKAPFQLSLTNKEPEWLSYFPTAVQIGDKYLWNRWLPIDEIINDIDFIKDKRNYGLYFRQSIKVITEKDFLIIKEKAEAINAI
jgi:hypothetical protein